MSERRRKALFVVATCLFALAVLAISHLGPGDTPPREVSPRAEGPDDFPQRPGARAQRTATRQAALAGRRATRLEDRHRHRPAQIPAGRRTAAERAARRFLAGFGRYEIGRLGHATWRSLEATTTASFLAELRAAPPRLPAGSGPVAPASVRTIEVLPAERGLDALGTLSRAGELEPYSFALAERGGRWLVAGIGG